MSKVTTLTHEFVEFIPDTLEEGRLYVSIAYATVVHKCCCGCGKEVVTPLSPTDWKLIFDGQTISVDPSIGNWSFPCQSHYWIRNNGVRWAAQWSKKRVDAGRAHDRRAKQREFASLDLVAASSLKDAPRHKPRRSFWTVIKHWWAAPH